MPSDFNLNDMAEDSYYINPLTDFGFKRVFGIDENKDLLIAFLNDCISQQVGVITELTYLNTEHYGLKSSEKKVVFDVLCKNERGEHFIIEMQRGEQTFFARRIVAYVSRLISSEMERGDREYNIPPVYSLNILEFEPPEFAGREGYFRTVRLKDDDNEIFYKNYALFFIELSKFAAHSRKDESVSGMGKWLHLLKSHYP